MRVTRYANGTRGGVLSITKNGNGTTYTSGSCFGGLFTVGTAPQQSNGYFLLGAGGSLRASASPSLGVLFMVGTNPPVTAFTDGVVFPSFLAAADMSLVVYSSNLAVLGPSTAGTWYGLVIQPLPLYVPGGSTLYVVMQVLSGSFLFPSGADPSFALQMPYEMST